MKKKYSSILYILCIFTMLLAGMVLFLEESEAGTYNFYFNNTEQGANSTASPSLTVKDANGGVSDATNGNSKNSNSTLPAPGAPGVTPAAPAEEIPAGSSQTQLPEQVVEKKFPRFRIFGGGASTTAEYESYYSGPISLASTSYRSRYRSGEKIEAKTYDYLASATFFLTKDFALSWLMGRLTGPEFEIYYLKKGQTGFQSAILIGGFQDKTKPAFDHFGIPQINKSKKYQAHLGINLAYNFTESFGILGAYRAGIGDNDYKPSTLSGGASVYF